MLSLKKISRFLGIRGKIIFLFVFLMMSMLLTLSYIAGNQFRSVLLNSTLVVCRNLSFDISDVAREELLLNSIYANTRQVIKGFEQRDLPSLEKAFVVYRNGEIVAHTHSELAGKSISATELKKYSAYKKITQIDTATSLIFVDPITIHYQGRDYFLGLSIFEFDRNEIFGPIEKFLLNFWIIALVLLGIGMIGAIILAGRISKPVEILAQAAHSIGEGKLGIQVSIDKSDEIGKLAETFNQMSSLLDENQKRTVAEAAMRREMEIARDIQMSMLPPNGNPGPYEFRGYMKTADDVGGDYYDCIEIKNKNELSWWFLIGDVSGHGLTAGLTMLMAQTAVYTALSMKPGLGSKEFFTLVNLVLYQNIKKLKQQKYMTATFLKADPRGFIQYSGLHLDLLVFRKKKKKVEIYPTEGLWLGVEPDIKSVTNVKKFKLNKGDILFLFTDGMVEAMNDHKKMYSQERLTHLIENHSTGSLENLETRILADLKDFCSSTNYEDDITFSIIRKT